MFKKIFKSTEQQLGDKSQRFANLLKERDIHMDMDTSQEGVTTFITSQKIVNGPAIRVMAMFSNEETRVHQYIFDYVTIENSMRTEILQLINAINEDYIFTNFYLTEDNFVNQKYSIDTTRTYDPEDVLDQLVTMIGLSREKYGDFMKLLWK